MSDLERTLTKITSGNIASATLSSSDPFEALYRINPEIATIAYAHKNEVLTPQLLPYITRFRELQSNEKIALVRGLVEKYSVDRTCKSAEYRVDGERDMTRISEQGKTRRTELTQDGLTRRTELKEYGSTKRTKINANVRLDAQKRAQQTAEYQTDAQERSIMRQIIGNIDMTRTTEENKTRRTEERESGLTNRTRLTQNGLTSRTEMTQNGLTSRTRIEMDSIIHVQRLKCEAGIRAIQEHMKGKKYLSDNQLRAVYVETKAYKDAIETREKIRAEKQRGVSRDILEERIKTAAIDFVKCLRQAEILRRVNQDRNMTQIVISYIQNQASLYLETFSKQTEIEIAQNKLKEEEVRSHRKCYINLQKTVRKAIDFLGQSVSNGKDNAQLDIETDQGSMSFKYSS